MDTPVFVEYEVANRIAFITMNRPEKRNALNEAMVTGLRSAFSAAESDGAVRVVVLKAVGDAFSAGADLEDLRRMQDSSFAENLEDSHRLAELYRQVYNLEKPVIAQVEGSAVAGGCGLATVCDLSYSVPEARFGYTEVRIGFVPALVSVFLVRKIGEGRARELLLTGKLITAQDAFELGMINGVMGRTEIASTVRQLAMDLAANSSGNSIRLIKQLISGASGRPLAEAIKNAAAMNAEARGSEDCKKGIRAFLNREKIAW